MSFAARIRNVGEALRLADRIAVMSELRIVGELVNDHDCPRMSQQTIRMIHAETHAEAM